MTTTITTILAASEQLGIARTPTAMIKVGAELEFTISHDTNGLESHSYLLSKVQNGHRMSFGDKFSSLIAAFPAYKELVSDIEDARETFLKYGGGETLHGEFCSQKGCSGTRGTCGRLNGFVA